MIALFCFQFLLDKSFSLMKKQKLWTIYPESGFPIAANQPLFRKMIMASNFLNVNSSLNFFDAFLFLF